MTDMTNREILEITVAQSAVDSGCRPEDFLYDGVTVVESKVNEGARKYLSLPFVCDIAWYGHGVVASVGKGMAEDVRRFLEAHASKPEYLFGTPVVYALNEVLSPYGAKALFMAEYFLPDLDKLRAHSCPCELRVLGQEDFGPLYVPEWSNALCEKRKHLDVLGVGAYDDSGRLVGFAACSADCEKMWQIGVDVLPGHRGQGIASAVTSRLAQEILDRGKVPFYCAAWSNIRSVRNALRCGFRPSWVQLTATDTESVDKASRE